MNRLALASLIAFFGCSESKPTPPAAVVQTSPPAPEPAPVLPESEPSAPKVKTFDFKGAVPGTMTLAEFDEKHPAATRSDHEPGVTSRFIQETIANEAATAGFYFVDGVLAEVFLGFKHGVPVLTALRDRYGIPTTQKKSVSEWDGVDGGFFYEDAGGSPSVMFFDKTLRKELEQRRADVRRERRERNAKDL